ncbi:MAG: hypothetical protein IKM25_02990 [Clostridia bacterium]|nr:hypothetical protein [Clostridia bacterium]
MKKTLRRVISLVLCAAMLVSVVAFSGTATEPDASNTKVYTTCNGECGNCPVIVLPGINHSPTYLYDDEGNRAVDSNGADIGGTLLILNLDGVLKQLPKVILSLFATLGLQRNVMLDKVAYDVAHAAFAYQQCDDKGVCDDNLSTLTWDYPISEFNKKAEADDEMHRGGFDLDWVYRMVPMKPLVDVIGEDHTYFFTFNLVGNPMESAAKLDEYIQLVKAQTGHDKVNLLPVSLGGTILTAYLEQFGHEDVNAIVNAVACLDGTDLLADFMERKWNLSPEFFYHEFLANIFVESNDAGTIGYLINLLLRIIPESGINALLSGAMSGILDTMMLNCPQFWAMVPADRYDALAERYLKDKPELKEKTDAFQQARLNLKDNILAAVEDGVRVNSISGSNLNLGEEMYTYFGIVASSKKVNSDGIINLESTTMGATGAAGDATLGEGYVQKNPSEEYPEYSYVSPDNMVDVSTAVLPDNTWIFLDQYHEVGDNDVVLNLAKALLLEEIDDVHSDPENYPQFNYKVTTKYVRRWRLADAYEVDRTNLSADQIAKLDKAIADGEAIISATVAPKQEDVEAVDRALMEALHEVGYPGYENIEEEEASKADAIFETVLGTVSKTFVDIFGSKSYIDFFLDLIVGALAKI